MIAYLIQMIICSGILYGYYHLFLRNNRFHQYNRYYLLMSMLISLVIPFLKIPVYFNINNESNGVVKSWIAYNNYLLPEVVVSNAKHTDWWQQLLWVSYITIAAIWFFKIVKAVFSLISYRTRYPVKYLKNIVFVNTNIQGTPFSFFNWIFWNKDIDTHSADGEKIFRHKLYHVRQKHSFDILFAEIACAVIWLNPFFHLMKSEIKAIHEFLADSYAAKDDDNLNYAELLVLQAIGAQNISLVNPFFNNQFKRRINMLTTNQISKYQYLRRILVLPLALLIAGLFIISCKSNETKSESTLNDSAKTKAVEVQQPDSSEAVNPPPTKQIVNEPVFKDEKGNVVPGPEVFTKVEIDAQFPNGPKVWRKFLEKNLRADVAIDHGAKPGTYTTVTQFIVDKDGNISDVTPLTKVGYGMEEEAVRVIKMSGKWLPAIQNGKEVKAYRKQPITFQIQE